jgi:cytochrome c-type biogenesis protein CcsB
MDINLLKIALLAYLISSLGYIASLLVRKVTIAKLSTWTLAAAFAFHTISLLLRWVTTSRVPVIGMYESLSFSAWIMTAAYLAFQVKTKTRVLGAFVSPVVFLLATAAFTRLGGMALIPQTLEGGMVVTHVILSIAGEALFALASCAGLMYLIQDGLLKNKKSSRFVKFLPPLRDLDNINHVCLLWGFPLLTSGVIMGSLWAKTAWGSPWQWDPKQTWTLVAWLVYAFLLHQRLAIGWKGHKAAVFSSFALIILVILFAVEKMFSSTIHRFFI